MVVVTRAQKRLLLNMAKKIANQEPQLPNPEPQDDDSDNESVSSIEQDNTRRLSRLENELKDEIGAIASQVKEAVLGLNQQMEMKLRELDKHIHNLETYLQDQNNNQGTSQSSNNTVMRLCVAWPTGVQLLVFFTSSVPVVLFGTPGISGCRSLHVPVDSSSLLHHSIYL